MKGAAPHSPDRTQARQQAKLHAVRMECGGEIGDRLHLQRNDGMPRHPHSGVVQILKTLWRQFVAKEGRGADARPPGLFGIREHAGACVRKPISTIARTGLGCRPDQNARTLTREQIEGLVCIVDRPDEWTVQPVLTARSNGGYRHGARNEPIDPFALAEMIEPSSVATKGSSIRPAIVNLSADIPFTSIS